MIIFHHPARAKIKRTKWIHIKKSISLYVIKSRSYPYLHVYEWFDTIKNWLDSFFFFYFKSWNHPSQGIRFLQINAHYPSRPTRVIITKCLLGRLRPFNWPLSPKNIETFYIQRICLLLIEFSLSHSLDPLFHSDSIINRFNAEEMDAFPYY